MHKIVKMIVVAAVAVLWAIPAMAQTPTASVPEPGTLLLLGLGVAGLIGLRKKTK